MRARRHGLLFLGGVNVALACALVTAAPSPVPSSQSLRSITPADAVMQLWPGVRDTSEQVVVSPDQPGLEFTDDEPVRVRTVVSRVNLPWLGPRVLYLEEFLHDQPSLPRRQLLLRVETETVGPRRARVFPYTFKEGERWRLLNLSPQRLSMLRPSDIEATQGCDLVLNQEGDRFRGGTTGLDCSEERHGVRLYVDYRVVIGSDVYWYRRRLMRESDDELYEEVIGYNWFTPNEMRLFTCRVDYSASGKPSELRPLMRLDLHDQGGHAAFTAPDGRKFELSLHTEDWPFASERDSLLLLLEQPNDPEPLASAWTDPDAPQIGIDLGWLKVRCAPVVPDTGEVAS
jgi:hypothetical protein